MREKTVTRSKQTTDVHDMHHNLLSHRDTPNHGLILNVDNHTYNFHVYIQAFSSHLECGPRCYGPAHGLFQTFSLLEQVSEVCTHIKRPCPIS